MKPLRIDRIDRIDMIDTAGKLWNKFTLGIPGQVRFDMLSAAYRLFPLIGGVDYPRLVEWTFVLDHLPEPPARIIDVGSTTSLFPFKLNALGYETHCLDYRPPMFRLPESIVFHRQDLMQIPIASETFDAISCISVIEHVGMGKYGDPVCSGTGDFVALKELLRILKTEGRLLLTTNTGSCTHVFNGEIRYGKKRLTALFSLGEIEHIQYYTFDTRRWQKCSEADGFNQPEGRFGIVTAMLRKARGKALQSAGEAILN